MENKEDKLKKALDRYTKGAYIQEDIDFLIECSQDSELHKKMNDFMDEAWSQSKFDPTNPQNEEIYNIQAKDLYNKLAQKRKRYTVKPFLKYAAIFILVALSSVLIYKVKQTNELNNITYTEYSVEYGKTHKITLPDGTNVILNAGSKIKYPNQFIADSRIIEIDGEGFFDVSKNPDKPFIIKMKDNLSVTVLGTSFNVKAYEEDEDIAVTVETGLVQVDIPDASLKLRPNEQLVYNSNKSEHRKQQEDSKRAKSWVEGKLYFNQTPIASVVQELKRTYNKEIELDKNNTYDDYIYGEHENQSLESVLRSLYYSTNIKYRKEGDKIILYKD